LLVKNVDVFLFYRSVQILKIATSTFKKSDESINLNNDSDYRYYSNSFSPSDTS